MAKNIEMNYLDSGGYEVLYPKNVSDISLASPELQTMLSLSEGDSVDDAFDYINRQIILSQYDKAGINIVLKTTNGNPLSDIPIKGITLNYDGTGSVSTDSQGKAFGYCEAGNVTISCNNYADLTVQQKQIETIAGHMYDVELTGTTVNFKKYTSTTNVVFSNNVERVDVSCVGAGGGGAQEVNRACAGGGGGYVSVREECAFSKENSYHLTVGSGGTGARRQDSSTAYDTRGSSGGTSSFLSVSAKGGEGGALSYRGDSFDSWMPPKGNGNGGYIKGSTKVNPTEGNTIGYYSFNETGLYGGGGGANYDKGSEWSRTTCTTYGAGDLGAGKPYKIATPGFGGGGSTYDGTYEGKDIVKGGSGCVAIRMHLKFT